MPLHRVKDVEQAADVHIEDATKQFAWIAFLQILG